jgi:hypothetical protein
MKLIDLVVKILFGNNPWNFAALIAIVRNLHLRK